MEAKRILIVQTAFIGDVILITPLIRAVKELYPSSEIDVMVVPAATKLLENNPHICKIIPFAKRKNSLLTMQKAILSIRSRNYDLAISPHSSGRTHLLLWLSGIPRRIGFDRSLFPQLLTDRIKHPSNMHKINKNLLLLKFLSTRDFEMQTELFPSKADIENASHVFESIYSKCIIAIAPGSIWATKCWEIDSYAKLASELCANGYGVVLIGAEADKKKCDEIQHRVSVLGKANMLQNLAGKSNLLESAAIISKCALMVCNDSGALHIANAVKTRVFAFFGPTVQSIGYFPYREGDRVFEVSLDCRPCGSHGAMRCPLKHHNCMKQIKPETVLSAILAEVPIGM